MNERSFIFYHPWKRPLSKESFKHTFPLKGLRCTLVECALIPIDGQKLTIKRINHEVFLTKINYPNIMKCTIQLLFPHQSGVKLFHLL